MGPTNFNPFKLEREEKKDTITTLPFELSYFPFFLYYFFVAKHNLHTKLLFFKKEKNYLQREIGVSLSHLALMVEVTRFVSDETMLAMEGPIKAIDALLIGPNEEKFSTKQGKNPLTN